jgi:hypothetical protein
MVSQQILGPDDLYASETTELLASIHHRLKNYDTASRLMQHSSGSLHNTLTRINDLLQGMPKGLDSVAPYLEVADYYSRLDMPEQSDQCYKKACIELSDALQENEFWLRSYLHLLSETEFASEQDNNLRNFYLDLTNCLRASDGRIRIPALVLNQLMRQNLRSQATELYEEKLLRLGSSETNRTTVAGEIQQYVEFRMNEKDRVFPDITTTLDPTFTKRGYCLFLEGALQSRWQKLARGTGITIVQFTVGTYGIENSLILHKSKDKESDTSVDRCFTDLDDFNDVLPDFGKLEFSAKFDPNHKKVTVS